MESTASHPRLSRQRLSSPPRCKSARSHCRPIQNHKRSLHRNQQYSITALTDASGTVVERYAYTAYGTPTITDASGTTRTTTAVGNRYTFTGREWDETLALYHYRARMYDAVGGRFASRDPLVFLAGDQNIYRYLRDRPQNSVDPSGLQEAVDSHSDQGNPFGIPTFGNINEIINQFNQTLTQMTVEQAASQCRAWAAYDKKLGDDWLKSLKKCPCTKPDGDNADWKEYEGDTATHPGCDTCFRTPFKLGKPNRTGQQCCYDKNGDLITSGSGAGTPDRRHPVILANPLGHFINDVVPFIVCQKAGLSDIYLQRRPPDTGDDGTGKPCRDNPTAE